MEKTAGQKLQRRFGLENLTHIGITRVLRVPIRTYIILYDSHRPTLPITYHRAFGSEHIASVHSHPIAPMRNTPVTDLLDFNGRIRNSIFFLMDLSGQMGDEKYKATIQQESKPPKNRFYPLFAGRLSEVVTLSDLRDTGNVSAKTQQFRRRRNSLMGAENRTLKLIDTVLDEGSGAVTFQFLTEVTEDDELYGDDYEYNEVDPSSLNLRRNTSKTYELQIKVLDFFDWLETRPDEDESAITRAEVKEILDSANVQVFSTSPSFQFQGFNYWLSQVGGSIHPTSIEPQFWNTIHGDGDAFVDKHLFGALRSLSFFREQMASQLTKKLKDRGLL